MQPTRPVCYIRESSGWAPENDGGEATAVAVSRPTRHMRLGANVGYAGGIQPAIERIVAFEQAGLDVAWVPEVYGFDAATVMGFLAARTTRVQIGAAILPIYSRTPALIAMTAAGLDELSGGRAILGLGSSGPQVIEGWHGVRFDHPVERTREIIEICRRVWRREVITYDGSCYRIPLPPEKGTGLGKPLKMITHPARERIPIYVAALGPRNVEMTAEVAEGWLPIFYEPEMAHKIWGEALARGASRRPTDLGPLEVVAGGLLAIGEDVEHLRELERPRLALYIGGMGARGRNFYNDLVCRYGYEREAAAIQDLYLAGRKDEAAAMVPAGLIESTSLVGSASYVKERIAAYRESGVTVLNVNPVGAGEPARMIEQVRAWTE
jgi:F420-dependent oxidoreductase-like protein